MEVFRSGRKHWPRKLNYIVKDGYVSLNLSTRLASCLQKVTNRFYEINPIVRQLTLQVDYENFSVGHCHAHDRINTVIDLDWDSRMALVINRAVLFSMIILFSLKATKSMHHSPFVEPYLLTNAGSSFQCYQNSKTSYLHVAIKSGKFSDWN